MITIILIICFILIILWIKSDDRPLLSKLKERFEWYKNGDNYILNDLDKKKVYIINDEFMMERYKIEKDDPLISLKFNTMKLIMIKPFEPNYFDLIKHNKAKRIYQRLVKNKTILRK